jgi:acyl-lipid omega-6 desaturase (Delta-12 desaturase)
MQSMKQGSAPTDHQDARRWVPVLARYREASRRRSLFELSVTLVPFLALWALAWWFLSISPWLAAAIAVINGFFLVRLFAIQHDCGHGSFFPDRRANDALGRALGVLTLTPYDVWKRTHSIHHATAGNLDRRDLGDIETLTVQEYRRLPPLGRLRYRLYRHPLVLFGLGPSYMFLVKNRLPLGLMRAGWRYWASAAGTNAGVALVVGAIAFLGGWMPLAFIYLPTTLVAASIGMWLFYVQHQFEDARWESGADWRVHQAALHGSSHYVLPPVLRWLTANIGVHHVHHLYSRIPSYRLPEVLRNHPELAEAQRLTLRQSLACVRFHLWDEEQRKMLSFGEARAA